MANGLEQKADPICIWSASNSSPLPEELGREAHGSCGNSFLALLLRGWLLPKKWLTKTT